MSDFDNKYKEMQKYLPFLQNVIEKLRSSSEQGDDNPRKAQLKKMEVLHDLLKSNRKKLKMETLLKCEGLLIKLYSKMERIPLLQSENETSKPTNQTSNLKIKTTNSNTEVPSDKNTTVCSVDIVDITGPESPPPQPLEEVPPVEIPTERRCSPMPDTKSSRMERDKHKHCIKNERNYKEHGHHQEARHHTHPRTQNADRSKISTNDTSKMFNRRNVSATVTANTDRYAFDPLRNRDPRASNAFTHEIYSPEEGWVEASSSRRTAAATICNYKQDMPKSAEMFSRVRNLEQQTAASNCTAAMSIPVKVPTIPDVLKSPPLSASDISDLLQESGGKAAPSIAEIGIRRAGKNIVTNSTATTVPQISPMEAAALDYVRKKFAIATKSSPPPRDSPDVLNSPITNSPKIIPIPLPNERIALKYNPHPRTERNAQPVSGYNSSGSDTHAAQPFDPRLNHRRLSSAGNTTSHAPNSAAHQDPRLRNVAATCTSVGPYKQTQNPQHKSASLPMNMSSTTVMPSSKQPHIPSLFDVKVTDPRMLYNVNFPNTAMDQRPHVVPHDMPTNQTQIFSRRSVSVKTGVPVLERPVTQRSKSGYSSEENWDSDPDTPAVVQSHTHVTQIQPFTEHIKPRDAHTDGGFRPQKPPLLPTPAFGRPMCGNGAKPPHLVNPHFQQHSSGVPQYSNNCKFSALLNDKTERSKYFESKKQKQSQPRTYVEYRQAKARAAAEDAARKAAVTTKAANVPTKDIGEVSDVDSSVLAKLAEHPPVPSTLDKLYRGTDFTNCEFFKAKTNFKIPKKHSEKTIEKHETEPKSDVASKEDFQEIHNASTKDTATTTQDDKKKAEEKMQIPKQVRERASEKQVGKKNNKESVATNKQSSEKLKKKPAVKRGVQNKSQTTISTVDAKATIKGNTTELVAKGDTNKPVKETVSANKVSQCSTDSSEEQASTSTKVIATKKTQKTIEDTATLELAAAKKDADKSSVSKLLLESAVKDECNETKSMPTKEADIKIPSKVSFLQKLQNAEKPARILHRRNTMMVRGSLPEVDKEKLFSIKSLVYEDVQGAKEEELRKEIDAKMPKMNKSLAEIFQKTDDNCRVSTQNIISGKRRTRTNINFNEVQRSLEIFHHKRRSDPLKQPAEKTSPTTPKKKVSPKGKKGTKGNRKNDTSVEDVCEEELAESENIEDVTVVKTEKKPIKRRSAKVIQLEQALETSKPNKDDNEEPFVEVTAATVEKAEKSVKPLSRIDALMDEDGQKRRLLESFVQDILNPKKDKAQIFNLLSQILSEDNLKFVKDIVDSVADKTATQNEEVNEEVVEEENNLTSCVEALKANIAGENQVNDSTAHIACTTKPSKGKGKFKKKNELDRLNEDIRTMFISHGVLTATGRRMCTLVAAAEEANKTDNNTVKNPTPQEVPAPEVKCKSTVAQNARETPSVPRIRKSKVVLKQIDLKAFEKRANIAETKIDDVSADNRPPRKMPILKPHTPIKHSDVEDDTIELAEGSPAKKMKLDNTVKPVHARPGPKCSKKQPIAQSSDDEVADAAVSSDISNILPAVAAKTKSKTKSAVVKNTNKDWHSQSKWVKWCVLCDIKILYPAAHYLGLHGEFYAARLAPVILEQMKAGKLSMPYFGVSNKKITTWFYRCPFCLKYKRTQLHGWVEHIITHTGEYNFECSNCHRPGSKGSQIEKHIKSKCHGATVVRKYTPNRALLQAHVCHLCNYIQLSRQNIENHYVKQHDIPKAKSAKMGYTIEMFDTRDVSLIDNSRVLEFETKIRNEGLDMTDVMENSGTTEIPQQVDEAKSKEESIDSDDIPIALSLQCNKDAEAKKLAVEKALSSNIFVPTRETNDSPTMNNFAQSLFTITNDQETGMGCSTAAAGAGGISMAERLSQKFKSIQSGKAATTANTSKIMETSNTTAAEVLEPAAVPASSSIESTATATHSELQNQLSSSTETALSTKDVDITPELSSSTETALSTNAVDMRAEHEQQMSSSTATALTTKDVTLPTVHEQQTSVKAMPATTSDRVVDSPLEDDDDNWEDIEIIESAPSTTSSTVSAASSTNSKVGKAKNKNVLHKLNRLYATNNKLKKSLTLTMGNRKREDRKESVATNTVNKDNATQAVVSNGDKTKEALKVDLSTTKANATDTIATAVITEATVTTPSNTVPQSTTAVAPATTATTTAVAEKEARTTVTTVPNLGFRPLITNLDDLLPDSPCNDPLDLVPELTPMESLQDLCDVSSILNSDYMSDNWTAANLNNDNSQQANMQEALDFVKEQQSVQCTVNTIMPLTPLAAIQRIQNVGFSKSLDDNTYKFYCLSDNCTFLYSSELIGLKSHFICEHAQATWNGYCHICKVKVAGGGDATTESKLPLSAELGHMSSKHLIVANTTPILPVVDYLRQQSKSNSPALDEDRPRIKIRRLTGDCLSTTPTPTPTATQIAKSVSTFDENAQLVDLTHAEPRLVSTVSTSFLNQIPTTAAQQPVENRHFENIGVPANASQVNVANRSTTAPCELQIASVVSLQDKHFTNTLASSTAPLPVISNVCSLNTDSVSSPLHNASSLWAQHMVNERADLERKAAKSMEVSNPAATQGNANVNDTRAVNDTHEPQAVAGTVAVAQSTTGNFLITQTVSSQCVDGQLGVNISIANNHTAPTCCSDSNSNASTSSSVVPTIQFKCMASACKYQTRLAVAMADHLRFHDRQNFSSQREYLRCSQCTFLAEDVDGFIRHTERTHGMIMRGSTDTDYLSDTDSKAGSSGGQPTAVGNTTTGKDSNNKQEQVNLYTFSQESWEVCLKEIVTTTGVSDSKLFRCTVEDCKTKLTENSYFSHVIYHLSTLGLNNIRNRTYKCPHCSNSYLKPQKIKTHIKTHGVHKYFCYICTQTTYNIEQMQKHFEERHKLSRKLRSMPLPYKESCSKTFYVVYITQVTKYEVQQFQEKLFAEWQRKKSIARTHFKPSEINQMPLTPIFGKDLNCAICPYKTKVRTNLVRHLQMHTDDSNSGAQPLANVDPVNPVPCLNSSEKHFDKMTNLASSSLVPSSTPANGANAANGGANGKLKIVYEYVPDTKRFTCGVSNCLYLTISDDIFRSHLNALHSDMTLFTCPHCKEEICKRGLSVDRIFSHLRLHGAKLYVCESCGYVHYLRTVVERHIRQHDVQPPLFVKVLEYDRSKENAGMQIDNTPTPATIVQPVTESDAQKSKCKQKWGCNLCGYKTMTLHKMIGHTTTKHSCKNQYQCMHCIYNATHLIQIMSHVDKKHPGKKREARYVYKQLEGKEEDSNNVNAIDTRPLWQRDDPTRIRHIRGILMEDEEESERYRKRLCLDEIDELAENDDGDENEEINHFGLLCYYCYAQCASPEELFEEHWQATACTKFDVKKPFRFRVAIQLKCAHCLVFVGNCFQLKEHMKDAHKATKYVAADPQATADGLICGHCVYRGNTLPHLAQHTTRIRHKPFDLKVLSSAQLEKLKNLGTPLSCVQCLSCMELFVDQTAFEAHVLEPANNCENVSQKFVNKLIYACPFCSYASQREITVVRHMIAHYRGFKRCCFCGQPQTTFNGYMQHCYSDHREEIKNFCTIYTFSQISKFLQQMLIIFPNGLTMELSNLRLTHCLREYGNKYIKQLYEEIQKTSQQPPIPRLSLGRLVAKKCNEAKAISTATQETASASTAVALQLAGNNAKDLQSVVKTQKIMKRRSTIALGRDEAAITHLDMNSPSVDDTTAGLFSAKKRKIHHNHDLLPPPTATPTPAAATNSVEVDPLSVSDSAATQTELQPFSYYGRTPVPIDLSKVFIKIATANTVETRINISKLKLLYNIAPRVVLTPTDMSQYCKPSVVKRKYIKPCPASHKSRYT